MTMEKNFKKYNSKYMNAIFIISFSKMFTKLAI